MPHPFLAKWREWSQDERPFIFPDDEAALSSYPKRNCFHNASEYCDSPVFLDPKDSTLHLGLRPMPFLGDLHRAKVVFLLLNPGLKPGNYFAEDCQPEYLSALRRTCRQELENEPYPFLFLNPRFSWHSGFLWWHKKLGWLAKLAAEKCGGLPKDGLRTIASLVANIELYPYHSRKFNLPRSVRRKLQSAELEQFHLGSSAI